jgi:hypothetical protein
VSVSVSVCVYNKKKIRAALIFFWLCMLYFLFLLFCHIYIICCVWEGRSVCCHIYVHSCVSVCLSVSVSVSVCCSNFFLFCICSVGTRVGVVVVKE